MKKELMILGFDILFDIDLNCYLLEINYNPGFGSRDNKEYKDMENIFISKLIDKFIEPLSTDNYKKVIDNDFILI